MNAGSGADNDSKLIGETAVNIGFFVSIFNGFDVALLYNRHFVDFVLHFVISGAVFLYERFLQGGGLFYGAKNNAHGVLLASHV